MSAPEIEALASPPLATPWVPIWPLTPSAVGELGYAEFTAQAGVSGTTEANASVVVTAPAITCDGVTPVLVEFYCRNIVTPTTLGASVTLYLYMDGASLGALSAIQNPTSGSNLVVPVPAARRLTPAAGSHVFSIRAAASMGGFLINAGPGGSGQQCPGFIRVSLAAPIMPHSPGAALPVAYGTSLPTAPLDGQEAILVDSVTAPTYQWRFRYNAGSASPNKWEFVGGTPKLIYEDANVPIGANNGAWVTIGPVLPIPRSGEYVLKHVGYVESPTINSYIGMRWQYHPSGTAVGGAVQTDVAPGLANLPFVAVMEQPLFLNPGDTLVGMQNFSGGTMNTKKRTHSITPVRVA